MPGLIKHMGLITDNYFSSLSNTDFYWYYIFFFILNKKYFPFLILFGLFVTAPGVRTTHHQLRFVASVRRRLPESRGLSRGTRCPVPGGHVEHRPDAVLRVGQAPRHRPRDGPERVFLPVRLRQVGRPAIPKRQRWRVRNPLPLHRPKSIPQHRRRKFGFLFALGEYRAHISVRFV